MGRTDKKICTCMLLSVLMLSFAARSTEMEDANVVLSDFKLPEYNKDSKELEFIVSGKKAKTVGVMIDLDDVQVDWVEKDIKNVKATITSPSAVYDRATKMIKGDEEVHFRSLEMDADGIGFDANHEKQIIHIRSNVKVTLKNDIKTMYKEQQKQEDGE